jgi:hypothetical protein
VLERAVLASERERKERGLAGRRVVEARYGWPSVVEDLERACAAYC